MKRSFRPFLALGPARGFTIIELVVAIGVTALMVTLMLTITLNMLSGWNRSSGVLNTGNQARYILDQLALDLQGAVLPRSADAVFAVTIQGNQDVNGGDGDANDPRADWPATGIKPEVTGSHPTDSFYLNAATVADREIANYRFGQAGVWLRFLTAVSDNANSSLANTSAPRAVAYQIIRRQRVDDADAPYSYQLFRSEVRPYGDSAADQARSTFGVGYDLLEDNFYNNSTGATTSGEDPYRIRRPDLESLIGDGVIDFGVRVFVKDSADVDSDNDFSELHETFPVNRRLGDSDTYIRYAFVASSDTSKVPAYATGSGNPTVAQTSYGYPSVVEVMIRVLTPQGIQTIQAYESDPSHYGGYSAAKWWELAIQNSNVYTRRITIPSERD